MSVLVPGSSCPGYHAILGMPCRGKLVVDRGPYETDQLCCDVCDEAYGDPIVVPVRVGGPCPGVRGQRSLPCDGVMREEPWGAQCDACGYECLDPA